MSEPVGGPLSRRRFVRGSAAAASAVVAVTYVSPTLRSIRMPTAYAAVSAPDEAAVLTVGTGRAGNDVEGINRGEIPHGTQHRLGWIVSVRTITRHNLTPTGALPYSSCYGVPEQFRRGSRPASQVPI